jgi:hypothetical protein
MAKDDDNAQSQNEVNEDDLFGKNTVLNDNTKSQFDG